jgi:hypothetical protein
MWKKIFVTRLLCRSWLGVMEEVGKSVRACRINRVVLLRANCCFEFSKLQKLILQTIITRLAALRTFYQRPDHNNRSHNQRY